MDTQQFEYTDATSTKVDMPPVESSQPGDLAMLPPASNRNDQLNDIGSKISNFFQKLPEYVAKFYRSSFHSKKVPLHLKYAINLQLDFSLKWELAFY